jgi:glycogen debranching enzyme
VQGYTYAALLGAAALPDTVVLTHDRGDLVRRAESLRARFNERFWDERGWFGVGLDGRGRLIDALTTNAGHALWTGIADPSLADAQIDRFLEPGTWSGWGLRTLAEPMAAYDPLSYHNGSVWPHDTALCAAGAARYGRWDVVDRIVAGALDAAEEFGGRPPELFAGIARDDAPMPVAYPSSCSPQAWSSASILLLLGTMLGLEPATVATPEVRITRPDLAGVPDLVLERVRVHGASVTVRVQDGVGSVEHASAPPP